VQAGEKKLLQLVPNPVAPARPAVNPVDLTGASCALKIRNPATGQVTTVVPTPAFDGGSALYQSQSADFPVAGVYTVQLFATLPDGSQLKSPEIPLPVGPSL